MRLDRAEFLGLASAAFGGATLSGCTQIARTLSAPDLPERIGAAEAGPASPEWRILNRTAYGPRPGDLERVREMGIHAYLEEQLSPASVPETRAGWMRLLPMDTLDMDSADAGDWETSQYPPLGKGPVSMELQQACLLRAVYSARQLQEVMVEFWSDHFNITQLKLECSWLKTVDDRLIRKHAFGKFRDLLNASARSPAMLYYLDNDKNRKPEDGTPGSTNENYARELLELHTLGVDGGYTLKDIQEVARCLTGWSYNARSWPSVQGEWPRLRFERRDFAFYPDRHDDGPKEVLGVHIPAGQGVKDGEQVIDIVSSHPSTARFIARKLCRRFIADSGPLPLIDRLARVFERTDGDLRQVASELFHSEEFLRGPARKFKRPFDFTVSALRITNADTTGAGVLPHLERMGQLPYKWTMPDGYPDAVAAWAPSLLARWNFALDLVTNRIGDTSVDAAALARRCGAADPSGTAAALSRLVLGRSPARELQERLAALAGRADDGPRQLLAALLAHPSFQWR